MADGHTTSIERLNKAALAAGFSMAPPEDAFEDTTDWIAAAPARSNLPAVIDRSLHAHPRELFHAMGAAAARLKARLPGMGWRAPA